MLNKIAMWVVIITLIAGFVLWYSFRDAEIDFGTFDSFENAVETTIEGAMEGSGNMDHEIHAEKAVSVPKKQLVMDVVSSDISLKYHNKDEVRAVMHGFTSTADEDKLPKLIINDFDDKVTVKVQWPKVNLGFISTDIELDVYIPSSYTGQVMFETVSGDVRFDDATFDRITVNTVSGEFECGDIVAGKFDLATTSGDFELNHVSGEIEFESVSGKMDFTLSEWKGDVKGSTVSGDVSIFADEEPVDVRFDSVSGDVEANYKFDSVDKKDDDVLIASNNNSAYEVVIETVSGDIRLND